MEFAVLILFCNAIAPVAVLAVSFVVEVAQIEYFVSEVKWAIEVFILEKLHGLSLTMK